jgi:hypothetical protein
VTFEEVADISAGMMMHAIQLRDMDNFIGRLWLPIRDPCPNHPILLLSAISANPCTGRNGFLRP